MQKISALFHGVVGLERKDGYLIPRRFTSAQIDCCADNDFFYARTRCCASVTIELITEAENISFDYKFFLRTGVKSTFEVYVDGFLTHLSKDCELSDEGTLSFSFKKGKKRIEVYIPNYSEVGVKNVTVDGKYVPVRKKRTKVLFIGDSITQGGGSERSGQTYVNFVKRALRYEILNWGIGGFVFDEKIVQRSAFTPKKIVVAMGTNNRGWSAEDNERAINAFFEKINALYPNIPVLAIAPPWAGDMTGRDLDGYRQIKCLTRAAVARYPHMKLTNAYEMIPHFSDYFMDDLVHPNALGMEVYGQNLVKAIKENGF